MILRALTGLLLILGLFFLPWVVVAGAAVVAAAFFPWYLEVFLIALVSAAVSGAAFWKMLLIWALVLLGGQWFKSRINASKAFSIAWASVLGGLIFLLSAFVFL